MIVVEFVFAIDNVNSLVRLKLIGRLLCSPPRLSYLCMVFQISNI